MKVAAIVSLAIIGVASAAPSWDPPKPKQNKCSSDQVATFDNLPAVPAIPEINPVGTYMGLKYNSFNVLQQGVAGIITTGITPQSGVQVASNGITDSVLNGAPAIAAASPYKSFSLKSLYFGCVANSVESAAGVPQQCTVAITAYLPGSNKAYQTINQQFNPTNALLSKMTKVTLPSSWQKMGQVKFAVVQSTLSSQLTGLLIDNLAYDLCE